MEKLKVLPTWVGLPCGKMSNKKAWPRTWCWAEVGQYQIMVQYQYQYFLKFHFQYQDQYQYCPRKTIKININIKTNIFSKRNIKIKINILKILNSISIPVSISSIYWYWKSIFHWAILTALDFLLDLAVISDENFNYFSKIMVFCDKTVNFS